MPTSRWYSERAGGFTLVEMLVVLAVLSLGAVLLVGRLGTGPTRFARQRVVAELKAGIAGARREALRSGHIVRLDPARIDAGASLEAPVFGQGRVLLFFADGSSSGGTLRLGGEKVLSIDWLTGEARGAE